MEDNVDRTGMVFYEEPVAHILTLTIDGQWLTMADIVDEERNQLLWELIRTLVARAVGNTTMGLPYVSWKVRTK